MTTYKKHLQNTFGFFKHSQYFDVKFYNNLFVNGEEDQNLLQLL